MKKLVTIILLLMTFAGYTQTVIPLYKGFAPGSENWNWKETYMKTLTGTVIMDASIPSLTVFVPANPNGTAVIIAPGGAFHALAMDLEGTEVARRLNAKGVTAFVLKYRLVHEGALIPPEERIGRLMATRNYKKLDSINAPIVLLALQDGLTAVRYVRTHAMDYNISRDKIGFMGFSAGGTLSMSVVYSADNDSRPNFVAAIYPYEGAIIGSTVPAAKTPIFLAAASDDDLGFATHSVHLYLKWLQANQPAELHMYEKGKHGFGTKHQGLPVDSWMDRFDDWLILNDLIK